MFLQLMRCSSLCLQGRRIEKADAPSMRVPESAGEPVPSDDEDEDRGVEEFL